MKYVFVDPKDIDGKVLFILSEHESNDNMMKSLRKMKEDLGVKNMYYLQNSEIKFINNDSIKTLPVSTEFQEALKNI
jgi:hypothetical protein